MREQYSLDELSDEIDGIFVFKVVDKSDDVLIVNFVQDLKFLAREHLNLIFADCLLAFLC